MTGKEILERVRKHYLGLSYGDLEPGDEETEQALDGCTLLTREEAERMAASFRLWREGTPRRIEGRGIVVLADEEIEWALAMLEAKR